MAGLEIELRTERYGFVSRSGTPVQIGIDFVGIDGERVVVVAAVVGDRSSIERSDQWKVALAGAVGSVPILREANEHITEQRALRARSAVESDA